MCVCVCVCVHLCVFTQPLLRVGVGSHTVGFNEVLMPRAVCCTVEQDEEQTHTDRNVLDGVSVSDGCLESHKQLFTSPTVEMYIFMNGSVCKLHSFECNYK